MKICVLASGSKCNSTYIETSSHKILIDMGTSLKYTKESLEKIGIDIKDIDTILITHSHSDHTKGLEAYTKKYDAKIYIEEATFKELGIELPNYELITEDFKLDNLYIEVVRLSHDTASTIGYVINEDDKSMVYITDTGYINKKYLDKIRNKDLYIMESNHDVEMLMTGKYQYHTKIRIVGDYGHLSNTDSAKYLSNVIGDNTKYILLAHLSHENNTKEKAYETLKNKLDDNKQYVNRIIITSQDEISEVITL